MGKSDEQQMAKLVKKLSQQSQKPKKNPRRKGDPTLPPETTDADMERQDFFKEMKKREF